MTNSSSKQVGPELDRLKEIQQRYSNTVDYPNDTYQVRANDLTWLINEIELSRTRRVPVDSVAPGVDGTHRATWITYYFDLLPRTASVLRRA